MIRTRSRAREEFLRDILITAIEGGVNYWAEVTSYEPSEGRAIIVAMDDVSHVRLAVDLDVIAHGIEVGKRVGIGSSSGAEYVLQFMLANRTNGADGDYDAEIADQIVQLGLYDQVVYG